MINIRNWFTKKIISFFYSTFYYDFPFRRLLEFLFPMFISALLLINKFFFEISFIKYYITTMFITWSGLALIGFFIPTIKDHFTIIHPSKNTDFPKGPGGIPVEIIIKAKGGFIAGRKINILLRILKFDKHFDTQKEFIETFKDFNLVWFGSLEYPTKRGLYMGMPSAGGVGVKPNKLKGKSKIIFNSPGKYSFRSIYTFKDESTPHSISYDKENEMLKEIFVSPSENYISLRNFSITYSLTLLVLLLTIIQLNIF